VDQTSSSVIMVAVSHHDGSATETMIVETCLTNRTVRSPLPGQVVILKSRYSVSHFETFC